MKRFAAGVLLALLCAAPGAHAQTAPDRAKKEAAAQKQLDALRTQAASLRERLDSL